MTSQGSSNMVGSDDATSLAAGESESVPEDSLGVSLVPSLTSNLHMRTQEHRSSLSFSHARTQTDHANTLRSTFP